jgi:hypothetical protein
MRALAYVYSGDWVADCTRPGCGGAEFLYALIHPTRPPGPGNPRSVRKAAFHCSSCAQLAEIEWPDEALMQEIQEILAQRPIPHTRNWYPADHPGAVKFRIEHGQSAADLREENAAHGVAV